MWQDEDLINFHTWVDTSQEAYDFLRKNKTLPTMDGAHILKDEENIKTLLEMWKKNFKTN